MRYCSTWLRSLLCYIKNFVTEEFVIRVLHCTLKCLYGCRMPRTEKLVNFDLYIQRVISSFLYTSGSTNALRPIAK